MNHKHITEQIITDTPMELPQAVLYGVNPQGETVELGRYPDIYDLLAQDYDNENLVGIAIHTTGWAAPLNADGEVEGAPSKHPQRRRVALIACVSYDRMGSALSFQDDPTEIVTDEGEATGSLADALMTKWKEQGHPF